jgi:hypothetical protein
MSGSSSATDNAFYAVTSALHQEVLQQPLLTNALGALNGSFTLYPYYLPEDLLELLAKVGLSVTKFGHKKHAHAANKSLENFFLFEAFPAVLSEPTTMISIKRSKIDKLRRFLPPDKANLITHYINPIITSHDLIRYTDQNNRFLPALHTPTAFIHDALHYLSPRDICRIFSDSDNLHTIYATAVLPIEACNKENSKLPQLYTLAYPAHSLSFIYSPEGHSGGAYIQPLAGLFWLMHNQVITPSYRLKITKIDTRCAHHLFQITRLPVKVPEFNVLPSFDLLRMPQIYIKTYQLKNPYIPHGLFARAYYYTKSIKNVDERTLYAKIRQLLTSEEFKLVSLHTAYFLVDALLFIHSRQWHRPSAAYISMTLLQSLSTNTLGLIHRYSLGWLRDHYFNKILKLTESVPSEIVIDLRQHFLNPLDSHTALYDSFDRVQLAPEEYPEMLLQTLMNIPFETAPDIDDENTSAWKRALAICTCLARRIQQAQQRALNEHYRDHIYGRQDVQRELLSGPTSEANTTEVPQIFGLPTIPRHARRNQPRQSTLAQTPLPQPPHNSPNNSPALEASHQDAQSEASISDLQLSHELNELSSSDSGPSGPPANHGNQMPEMTQVPHDLIPHITVPPLPNQNPPVIPARPKVQSSSQMAVHDVTPNPEFTNTLDSEQSLLLNTSDGRYLDYLTSKGLSPLPRPSKNLCLFEAFALLTNVPVQAIWDRLHAKTDPNELRRICEECPLFGIDTLQAVAELLQVRVNLHAQGYGLLYYGPIIGREITMYWRPFHITIEPEIGYTYTYSRNQPPELTSGKASLMDISTAILQITHKEWKTYTADPDRAQCYLQDLEKGNTGTLHRRKLKDGSPASARLNSLINATKHGSKPSTQLLFEAGFAGCGKTSPIAQYIARLVALGLLTDLALTILTPRVRLRKKMEKRYKLTKLILRQNP